MIIHQHGNRHGQANQHNGSLSREFWLEQWEKKAIVDFYIEHRQNGYVAPRDKLGGRAETIFAERKRKPIMHQKTQSGVS